MFERFTQAARKAVEIALSEAVERGDRYVGTEHLLMGVMAGAPAAVKTSLNLSLDDLRSGLDSMDYAALDAVGLSLPARRRSPMAFDRRRTSRRRFTSGAKQVLEQALREGIALGDRHLGPEHILLAITVRPSRDPAVQLLERLGTSTKVVRERLLQGLRRAA